MTLALGVLGLSLAEVYLLARFGFLNGKAPDWGKLLPLKHADFVAYYTAARMVDTNQGQQLYHLQAQAIEQAQWLGGGHYLLAFVNPPFLALLLAPLGYLPYVQAFVVWMALLLAAIATGVVFLVKASGFRGTSAWLVGGLAVGGLSVWVTVFQGQSTAFALLGLGLGYWAWSRQKMTLAGVALALTLFKPHLILLLPGLLLVRREWRILAIWAVTGAVLVVVSAIVFSPSVWLDYLRLVGPQAAGTAQNWVAGTETKFGLLGILTTIGLSYQVGLLICAALGLAVLAKINSRRGLLALDFALAMVASFVLAPHANFHDAVLLVASGVVVAGVLAHDVRASFLDKLILGAIFLLGLLLTVLPPIVTAFAVLLWAVHLDYLRFLLSPLGASDSATV